MGNGAARRILVAATVGAASLAVWSPPAAAAPPDAACVQPTIEDLGRWVPEDDDVPGEAFGVVWPVASPSPFLDTDDDGLADTFTYDLSNNRIDIVRGDGAVAVTGLPPTIDADSFAHGDLDGDGRDELWSRFRTPGMLGHQETLVISGALPVGSSAAASVALSVRGDVIGDVSGDGLDDVQVFVDALIAPELIGHRSFVGAFAPGQTNPAFPSAAPYYGIGGDVDLDGLRDVVTIGRNGAPGTLHLTATDTTLAFTPSVAYGAVVFYRLDGATYFVTDRRLIGTRPHQRFRIRLDCNAPWVRRAGQAILGRPGTAADLAGLAPTASSSAAQRGPAATTLVRSAEGRGHLVDQRFQQALGRATDPVGRAWWVTALREGRRNAQDLSATLFGSAEFYRAYGSTPDGWVAALYQRSLGYAPDPAGATYWKAKAATLGRERAAVRFLNAPAARRSLVRAWFLDPAGLGRAATPTEVAAGEAAFAGGGWDAFLVWATTTDGYYLLAQATPTTSP